MSESPQFPLPEPNFDFLVQSLLMQAQMQLGLIQFGDEEGQDSPPDLLMARHSIDLLAVLEEKTRGNLTTAEQRLLENGLTELRFRFVQIANEQKSSSASQPVIETSGAPRISPDDNRSRIISAHGGKGSKTE